MSRGADVLRIGTAGAVVVSAAVPTFLVGALAPRITTDIPFGAAEVGIAMAACYTVAGVLSPLGGGFVHRIDPAWAGRLACALATVGCLIITVAASLGQILAGLAVVGVANALSQPTSNQMLLRLTGPRRQAFAFGAVQAAIPTAALVAGAALATTSRGVDWRWVTAAIGLITLLPQVVIRRDRGRNTTVRQGPMLPPTAGHRGSLIPLIVTGGLASAAATALPSFTATTGLDRGLSAFAVAAAQMAGSLGSIVVRIVAPVLVSHASPRRRVTVVAGLIAAGSTGLLILFIGIPALFTIGAVLGFALGWGWNGLYNQVVATSAPDRVATATGMTQAGVFLGGVVGPALFALVVAAADFSTAWLTMAVLMAIASGAAVAGRPRPDRRHPDPDHLMNREALT